MTDQAVRTIAAGLIGCGIQGSRSPFMHTSEAAAQGADLTYNLFDLDEGGACEAELHATLAWAQARGYAGVNVTYPFKQAVIRFLDELSTDADALGAVNTVVFRNGRRLGFNTDWSGFAESFRRGLPGAPTRRVVQLGAGGAGAAVAYALLSCGVRRLEVIDVDPARAEELVRTLGGLFDPSRAAVGGDVGAAVAEADGLVNCTPVGMSKHPGTPVPAEVLHADLWVAEIVYFPLETELLRAARQLGCRTLDGGGMAVLQAAEAFRLFTGLTPDVERMLRRFCEQARGAVQSPLHD
jgi:shikimate dehydrogenase